MQTKLAYVGLIIGATLMVGCQSSYKNVEKAAIDMPIAWHTEVDAIKETSGDIGISDAALISLISQGLENNYQLKSQFQQVQLQRLALNITESDFFPTVKLSTGQSRRKSGESSFTNSAGLDIDLSYEVDIWGSLSDEKQRDAFTYAAEQSNYEYKKLTTISDIAKTWFNLIEARKLVSLYQQRVDNLRQNQDIIDRSYKLGLSDALDVYLSQNNLFQETSRLAQQQQTYLSIKHQLNLLLGRNPNAELNVANEFPSVNTIHAIGVPSDLLARRTDIQNKWLKLLALDKGVAVAHKARFPKLSLTASSGIGGSTFSDLKDNTDILWSIAANLVGPIFDAGRLANLEEQAKVRLFQSEEDYRYSLWQAISEVELLLAQQATLDKRKTALENSEQNAIKAEKLAFNQYQKGLVNYNTVLESQRRAFDAKTSLIQVNNQIIQNKINMFVALGGDYKQFVVKSGSESQS